MYTFSEFGLDAPAQTNTNWYETLSGEVYRRYGTIYQHPVTFEEMEVGDTFTLGVEVYRRNTHTYFDVRAGFVPPSAAESHWAAIGFVTHSNTTMLQNALVINTPVLMEWVVTKISETQIKYDWYHQGSLYTSLTVTMTNYMDHAFKVGHGQNGTASSGQSYGLRFRNMYYTETGPRLRNWEFKKLPLIPLNDVYTPEQLNGPLLGIPVGTVIEMKPDVSQLEDSKVVGLLYTHQSRLRRVSLRTQVGEVHSTFGHKELPVQELQTLNVDSSHAQFYRQEEFLSAESADGFTQEQLEQVRLRTEFKFQS